jgi:hypothetical protein
MLGLCNGMAKQIFNGQKVFYAAVFDDPLLQVYNA